MAEFEPCHADLLFEQTASAAAAFHHRQHQSSTMIFVIGKGGAERLESPVKSAIPAEQSRVRVQRDKLWAVFSAPSASLVRSLKALGSSVLHLGSRFA